MMNEATAKELVNNLNCLFEDVHPGYCLRYTHVNKLGSEYHGAYVEDLHSNNDNVSQARAVIPLYEEEPFEHAIERIWITYTNNKSFKFDARSFTKEKILSSIRPILVSCDEVGLEDKVKRPLEDMYVLYRFMIDNTYFNGEGSIVITEAFANNYSITEEELYDAGVSYATKMRNVMDMRNILSSMACIDVPADIDENFSSGNMVILTTKDGKEGASVILSKDAITEAMMILGSKEIYLLPSSVSEMLAMRTDVGMPLNCIQSMVADVNDTQVPVGEVLTYSVYKYTMDDGLKRVA